MFVATYCTVQRKQIPTHRWKRPQCPCSRASDGALQLPSTQSTWLVSVAHSLHTVFAVHCPHPTPAAIQQKTTSYTDRNTADSDNTLDWDQQTMLQDVVSTNTDMQLKCQKSSDWWQIRNEYPTCVHSHRPTVLIANFQVNRIICLPLDFPLPLILSLCIFSGLAKTFHSFLTPIPQPVSIPWTQTYVPKFT